jgi:Domain of unknown function (DUF4160)
MPTVLRIGSMRFAIHLRDEHEPPHVHVDHPDGTVVVVLLEASRKTAVREAHGSVSAAEIRRITIIIEEHFETLLAIWSRYHR